MFDFMKQGNEAMPDVKLLRHRLLNFIKEQLQRWEGEGSRIKGMQLFIAPPPSEKHLYEAVIGDESSRFKNEEVQKIADDYAIELPAEWNMEILFQDELPGEAVKAKDLPVALHMVTSRKPTINKPMSAVIKVLNGEAEQAEYAINSKSGKIFIGRDRTPQTSGGFARVNTIAFPGNSTDPSNKYISRQHAHIEWNNEAGCFFLFADEGGIPPRNKVKVQTSDGALIKLQTTRVGHPLGEGDQILIGETALLQLNYKRSLED